MKKTLVILSLIAALAVFFRYYDIDTVDTHFEDYQQATNNGIVPPDTWLPQFLPRSARAIKERHNIDTNEAWVSFGFDKKDAEQLKNACHAIAVHDVKFPREDRSKAINWWQLNPPENGSSQHGYFRCDAISFLFVNEADQVAFFWTLAR